MGVYIGQSTRIYDRETGEIHYGVFLLAQLLYQVTYRQLMVNTAYTLQLS